MEDRGTIGEIDVCVSNLINFEVEWGVLYDILFVERSFTHGILIRPYVYVFRDFPSIFI